MTPPPPSAAAVVRPLYRSLLRAARHFSRPPHGPVLSSLIHRTGREDGFDPVEYYGRTAAAGGTGVGDDGAGGAGGGSGGGGGGGVGGFGAGGEEDEDGIPREVLRSIRLPAESARDLTRGYDDLRRIHYRRSRGIEEPLLRVLPPSAFERAISSSGSEPGPEPHACLFRSLLGEVMGGGDAQMRFPSQIAGGVDGGGSGDGLSALEEVIRREFRAPSLVSGEAGYAGGALSSKFPDPVRREAAFLALRELNKKLAWASRLGLDLGGRANADVDVDGEAEAAPPEEDAAERNRRQAARGVSPLPAYPPASYLRPGAFLVAHPLLTGYFARTVIVLLEHTPPEEADDGSRPGGTYGIVVNRHSFVRLPNSGGSDGDGILGGGGGGGGPERRRPRLLREVLRMDCMPSDVRENFRDAFGDCPVREGGPVNVSVQMLHAASPELEERLKIGGTVVPMVEPLEWEEEEEEGRGDGATGEVTSAAMDTDAAVYFKGQVMEAAKAVVEGEIDRDEFSFVVGASTWTTGQLESEVRRGYWLPCRAPPHVALTGMCEHVGDDAAAVGGGPADGAAAEGGSGAAPPSSRPKPDLWLSMMCALGEHEAALARLVLDGGDEHDENGIACDDV